MSVPLFPHDDLDRLYFYEREDGWVCLKPVKEQGDSIDEVLEIFVDTIRARYLTRILVDGEGELEARRSVWEFLDSRLRSRWGTRPYDEYLWDIQSPYLRDADKREPVEGDPEREWLITPPLQRIVRPVLNKVLRGKVEVARHMTAIFVSVWNLMSPPVIKNGERTFSLLNVNVAELPEDEVLEYLADMDKMLGW